MLNFLVPDVQDLGLNLDLFGPALLTGLGFALYLPVLGCYLRLRDEILASLAYAQVGAAGALGAMALGASLNTGGLLAALGVASAKHRLVDVADARPSVRSSARSSTLYAVILVIAWGIGILLTSNFPLAERLGHALFDGQLLLSGGEQPLLTLLGSLVGLIVLSRLSKRLLLAQLFPDIWRLRSPRWQWLHLGFDLLAAISIAIATMCLGVMATFSLLLVLPWMAFVHRSNWRHACRWAMTTSVLGYLLAFGLSLAWDQPFGPVLALCLVSLAAVTAQLKPATVSLPPRCG
ncbi:MAG: hypothetical protein RIR18_495 [Pseudomonadota bacterium]|jgi:zinc transport system permease protein